MAPKPDKDIEVKLKLPAWLLRVADKDYNLKNKLQDAVGKESLDRAIKEAKKS